MSQCEMLDEKVKTCSQDYLLHTSWQEKRLLKDMKIMFSCYLTISFKKHAENYPGGYDYRKE